MSRRGGAIDNDGRDGAVPPGRRERGSYWGVVAIREAGTTDRM